MTDKEKMPKAPPPKITVLKRRSIAPLDLRKGDRITHETPQNVMQYVDLLERQAMVANEAIMFEMTYEGRRAIGSFVLEQT